MRWYDAHKRDLPWRRTADPYAIWVSEIMLQQTQVATVLPYYQRWMERFPTVEALAQADESDVLSYWQGLGYYRRARLLLKGAQFVAENGMPTEHDAWLKVPGVGAYTAAAISSIAYQEPVSLVDGNVERVYARLTGSHSSGQRLHSEAKEWASKALFKPRPGDWNQALMELGATVCTPKTPRCDICPVAEMCVAKQSWQVDILPIAEPKKQTVRLIHAVWVPFDGSAFGLRQVPEGEWWEGMWEFPRVAVGTRSEGNSEIDALRDLTGAGWLEDLGSFQHSVTHHRIEVIARLCRSDAQSPSLQWYLRDDLAALAMSSPQRKVLKLALRALGLESS
ncbi:MAG: A/G-specific adenine glycosylase [Fimbriimonadaceae bacterium]|nr:A/G-specific adenine glycosylase [Fimbriimonadaceae bacterium]